MRYLVDPMRACPTGNKRGRLDNLSKNLKED
jgi:hypothetical protein